MDAIYSRTIKLDLNSTIRGDDEEHLSDSHDAGGSNRWRNEFGIGADNDAKFRAREFDRSHGTTCHTGHAWCGGDVGNSVGPGGVDQSDRHGTSGGWNGQERTEANALRPG
jgi:hypothetical protein